MSSRLSSSARATEAVVRIIALSLYILLGAILGAVLAEVGWRLLG